MSYDLRVTSKKKRSERAGHVREFNGVMRGMPLMLELSTGGLVLHVDTPDRVYELHFSREATDFMRELLVTRTSGRMPV